MTDLFPRANAGSLGVLAYCHHSTSAKGGSSGFTFWHYRGTARTLAEIRTPGFFDVAADMLADGDMIAVSADDGGTVVVVTTRDGKPILLPMAF